MRSSRVLPVIDTHVEGLPVRVVTGGVPAMPGRTMDERRRWFLENSDHLRTLLMCEPRGNGWMSGAILQPSTREDADWGVLFIEVTGVLPVCGAGTIAVATALVEAGMVEVTEPVTTVRLDAPIGLITAEVRVREGRAESVTITGVPSYAQARDQHLEVPGRGQIDVDLAFGGNFYAFVDAASLGLVVERPAAEELIVAGRDIMAAVNEQLPVRHPLNGFEGCEHVVFLAPCSDARRARHALVNHPGWMDRSPGGTGTSALMAVHHARGDLDLGTDFVNESLLGTTFTGRLIERTSVGDHVAVVPTITGRAWITATAQLMLDPTDPFPAGFTI
ncbi:proline racemase family protein [Brachybacterium sacelli]|uniref:Proline racemase n=1 Tax=Brachybacterium sacelli TaxID=173364 RepID=A0ABS4X213_9MICO|nr:proline racemase family protein [Brachybacterium sacelli]MBP2381774.1 proline racemase [Brachybacterium sacelli]